MKFKIVIILFMYINRIVFRILLFCFLLLNTFQLTAQTVYHHVSNKEVYLFLDEMANLQLIELNSVIKPYSRVLIAAKLDEVQKQSDKLNKRQLAELNFYLRDFNKELLPRKYHKKRLDLFYYKDSLFTFSLNPILGGQYWSNRNGTNYHRWNGAEVFSYAGKHLGVYANLRDNHEDKRLSAPAYLDKRPAARYKHGDDFSEMRGGFTISWKWGVVGLVKDHFDWGNAYNYSSILSSKAPSIAHVKLNLTPAKWFEFNYIHGWLNSGVIDSVNSYHYTNSYGTGYRTVYQPKYIAANLFTFKPWKGFYSSVGNSIVYSDMNVHPAYLIPFMLYKSIDHTLNDRLTNDGGQNSQFFVDISSRQINHLHLYATLYFDDISISRLKKNGHLDYYSLNTGFKLSNLIPNTALTLEFFQSYPLVYKHNMPTTTYESNHYNLGHYMQDNSRALYTEIEFKPLRTLALRAFYRHEQHGSDHAELGTGRIDVVHLFLETIEWENTIFGVTANCQIINDLYVFGEFIHQNITGDQEKYTAPFYHGITNSWSVGMNFGF